jgi:hypothetical protein
MLRVKENEEFDRWWQQWIATVVPGCRVAEHPASGSKPSEDVVPKQDDFTR